MPRENPKGPEDEEAEDEIGQDADAGQDDDEGGLEADGRQEAEDDQAEEGLETQGRRPARDTGAVAEARREAREAREHAARVEREMSELRTQIQQRQPQGEDAATEAAKLALMSEGERWQYQFDKQKREFDRQFHQQRVETHMSSDRAAYQAKAAINSLYKKHEAKVEEVYQSEARAGRIPASRDIVLKYLIGEEVMAAQGATRQQRQDGQRRIQRQQARDTGGRGDRATTRRASSGDPVADFESRWGDTAI